MKSKIHYIRHLMFLIGCLLIAVSKGYDHAILESWVWLKIHLSYSGKTTGKIKWTVEEFYGYLFVVFLILIIKIIL